MRGCGFVGTNEHAIGFLAQVRMRVRIAHHRQFELEIDQLLERFGDYVVMQHVGDGCGMPGPTRHHIAVGASSVHHMLAIDVAVLGEHAPLAVGQQLDVGDPAAPMDFSAELARARRHGIGDIRGRHMSVMHGPERGLDAEGFEIGMMLRYLRWPDDLALVAR